mmetsp:Transcript_42394/g.140494  ORF Transcript_42394/g.140494 Transcript_42394/m.140494 type:complete len:271 (+) Transcript_42394:48-860(+)
MPSVRRDVWQRHTAHTGEKEPRPRATSNIQGHTVPHCPLCPTRRSQAVAPPDRDDLVEGACRLAGVVESSTAVGPLRRVGQPSEHDDDVRSNTKPLLCADCLDIFHREHLGVDEHEGRLLEGGEGRLREQRRRAGEITRPQQLVDGGNAGAACDNLSEGLGALSLGVGCTRRLARRRAALHAAGRFKQRHLVHLCVVFLLQRRRPAARHRSREHGRGGRQSGAARWRCNQRECSALGSKGDGEQQQEPEGTHGRRLRCAMAAAWPQQDQE